MAHSGRGIHGEGPLDDDVAGTLAEVGELAALRRIFPRLPDSSATIIGPGDDAAVLAAPDGRYVVTTDMMIAGPDFRWAWSTPEDIGWKAAATNLSDVAAMGARPTALVVAIAAPNETPVAVLEQIADGLRIACGVLAPGSGVVGGDLSVSEVFTLAVTAFGDLEGRAPVLRSGARPGDVVAHAGTMGRAAAGLRALFADGVDDDGVPDAARATSVASRVPDVALQRRPVPPIQAGPAAALAGATAMLDVSDGLALDAARIATASGVRIDLHASALGDDPALALSGGEDHALLACFPPDSVLPDPFRVIGRVLSSDATDTGAGGSGEDGSAGLVRVSVDGRPYRGAGGWDPYSGWDGVAG
ncbi:thiamine-phosphate kinase [Planctomonas sp. JC2975]|uniref:thiamine-phosphate kinase n=1 Tax=Planctomonas sp. JC2975 TaxID=2729626 RepID=UPI0014759588|nr:thiamine-phosphate kinase [Planctomonas sp. JC2975]NNC10996.1 thiamine-phosphate kinase [Planctomonas sp. JC2975]